MKKLLVTGATGHFGQAAIDALLKKGYPVNQVAALVRDESKAGSLKEKGVELRKGDYNDVASLTEAFTGIDAVLFVSASDVATRVPQHENVLKALSRSNVKQVVYTSFNRDEHSAPSAIDYVTDAHLITEKGLKESGKTYTFLRNNLYMDFIPVFIGEKVLETGVYYPAGDGKLAVALRAEMAEAAANVLLSDGHENKAYNLSNTEAWSFAEVAQMISQASGKDVSYYSPSQEEYKATLTAAGVPGIYVDMFAAFGEAAKQNEFNIPGNDLATLLGRKPTSLNAYLKTIFGKQ